MRKLTLALGVTAAMLLAGGLAWKADAMTWSSATSRPARRDQEYLAGRKDGLQRAGTLVPDRLRPQMRPLGVPLRALLGATRLP